MQHLAVVVKCLVMYPSVFALSLPGFLISLMSIAPMHDTPVQEASDEKRTRLNQYIEERIASFGSITEERRSKLIELSDYLKEEPSASDLIFICTHNSRRSHLSQVWAQTAADWYSVRNITTYSGGTEATAFNPRAVAALKRAGFDIHRPEGSNPKYIVRNGINRKELICFSKKYSDESNPQSGFVAVMTCSDADQRCPVVSGASARFSLPYVDPKEADDTDQEQARYDERCAQIATEMFFVMSRIGTP